MSSVRRPPELSEAPPFPRPLVGALPTAAMIMGDDSGSAAAAARAHTALRTTLREFARTRQRAAHDPQEIDRWENEGGPPGSLSARGPDVRVVHGRVRRAWAAHEVSHDEVAGAVRAYTRVLRSAGVPLAPSLVAVDAAVREHAAGSLPTDTYGAVQRDAARSCLQAYYGS